MQPLLERLRPLILGAPAAPSTLPPLPAAPARSSFQITASLPRAKLTTTELSELRYDVGEDRVEVGFVKDDDIVATLTVNFVDISFYAKQHLLKRPRLLDCGVELFGPTATRFLIPTGRSRTAGNGSLAVKYYDVTKPIGESDIEPFERVGIRPPDGVFTYAFFEAQYLLRSEDPRKGALFLIDPRMILLQYPMTEVQREEFQTFGGKKVLYFDVLGSPNIQEREAEIQRCRIRGDELKKQHEESDRKWEEERVHRIQPDPPPEEVDKSDKSKLSKKAKQKARQAAKAVERGPGRPQDDEEEEEARAEAEDERLHKQRQAESKAKVEEDARRERELEAERKKLEAADVKRRQEQEEARMRRVKSLLQKVQSKLQPANVGGYPEPG